MRNGTQDFLGRRPKTRREGDALDNRQSIRHACRGRLARTENLGYNLAGPDRRIDTLPRGQSGVGLETHAWLIPNRSP